MGLFLYYTNVNLMRSFMINVSVQYRHFLSSIYEYGCY